MKKIYFLIDTRQNIAIFHNAIEALDLGNVNEKGIIKKFTIDSNNKRAISRTFSNVIHKQAVLDIPEENQILLFERYVRLHDLKLNLLFGYIELTEDFFLTEEIKNNDKSANYYLQPIGSIIVDKLIGCELQIKICGMKIGDNIHYMNTSISQGLNVIRLT